VVVCTFYHTVARGQTGDADNTILIFNPLLNVGGIIGSTSGCLWWWCIAFCTRVIAIIDLKLL